MSVKKVLIWLLKRMTLNWSWVNPIRSVNSVLVLLFSSSISCVGKSLVWTLLFASGWEGGGVYVYLQIQ